MIFHVSIILRETGHSQQEVARIVNENKILIILVIWNNLFSEANFYATGLVQPTN